jgi:hypothetical protein
MLTILGGLAEFERTLIRARAGEGRERAKARAVRAAEEAIPTPASGGDRARQRRGSRRGSRSHFRCRPRYGVPSVAVNERGLEK